MSEDCKILPFTGTWHRPQDSRHPIRRLFDNPDDVPLTMTEVAAFLGVSTRTVRRYVEQRGLPYIPMTDHTLRFDVRAVRSWLQQRERKR